MADFGLLGEKLGHSFSPQIHRELGGYDYDLIELCPEELEAFFRRREFRGINVTIPYKQAVIPYLDELTPLARRVGAVNTIVKDAAGRLTGHNTDVAGFTAMMRRGGLDPKGRKCLVLGSGGASKTAVLCLRDLGAREVRVISRRGEDHYGNLDRHGDAELIVNATPVGMYPNNGAAPLDLAGFPRLMGVADLIYNPARTALLLQAEARGIPAVNGLMMLVAQGREAAERFLGRAIPPSEEERVAGLLARETENIVLIGMPGCGKSTVGRLLAERTGRPLTDTDGMIERAAGMTCGELIRQRGEAAFREMETRAAMEAGKASGTIIATGGGIVTRAENRDPLRQNGRLFHLDRPVEKLSAEGDRPLSQTRAQLEALYQARALLYAAWRDIRIAAETPGEAAAAIIREGGYIR